MDIQTPVVVKEKKSRATNKERDRKHHAYAALIAQGLSKSQAAQTLGYSVGSIGNLDRAVESKGGKLSLITEQNVRSAHQVVKRIMKGQTFGCIETIKDSTALRAAEVVLDRAEPKIQDSPVSHYSFTKIDLTVYQDHKM